VVNLMVVPEPGTVLTLFAGLIPLLALRGRQV
jgi:hypothetical protein